MRDILCSALCLLLMLEENVLAIAHMCACFQALSISNGIQLVSWFSPAFPTQKEEFVQDAKL